MDRAEQGLLQDVQDRLQSVAHNIDTNPEVSRRAILIGLGSLSAVTALQGVGALRYLNRDRKGEVLGLSQGDVCTEFDTACWLQEDGLPVPEAMAEPVQTIQETTTVPAIEMPPPPPAVTPPAPEPEPVIEAVIPPAPQPLAMTVSAPAPSPSYAELRNPKERYRYMGLEEYLANAELFINNLPSLHALHELWPGTPFFADPERQLAHIAMLDAEIHLDPDEFLRFDFDYSRSSAFEGRPENVPHMSIAHWTGKHYDSPDHMANSMKSGNVSVQLYRHNDNVTYQFVDQLNRTTGHTLGVNDWAIGLEMYSGDYDGVTTPLLNFEPVGTKQSAYALLRTHHTMKMPVNMTTMLTHMGADLIFINPYYDPYSGQFHDLEGYKPKAVRKFDLPQEFMQMMGKKIIALNQTLAA